MAFAEETLNPMVDRAWSAIERALSPQTTSMPLAQLPPFEVFVTAVIARCHLELQQHRSLYGPKDAPEAFRQVLNR